MTVSGKFEFIRDAFGKIARAVGSGSLAAAIRTAIYMHPFTSEGGNPARTCCKQAEGIEAFTTEHHCGETSFVLTKGDSFAQQEKKFLGTNI